MTNEVTAWVNMGRVRERLGQLGYKLPCQSSPVANYVPAVLVATANLLFTSGHIPRNPDGNFITGRLGESVSVTDGYEAAKTTALSLLSTLNTELGDLDRVKQVIKVLCFVNSAPDFVQQPAVANGVSDLLIEVFGDAGRHARSAVGVATLPANVCVEVELTVEVS